MLQIVTQANELYNEETNEFIYVKPQKIVMEHSLLSVSKWESRWKKPFLSKEQKANNEMLDYIRCMTITPKVDYLTYANLTREQIKAINDYINDTATATTISGLHRNSVNSGRAITSELIYYWMTALNIPFECEKWHLNRLLTLIRIANIENNPKKQKMGRRDIYNQNRALNAARRAKHNTRG